MSSKGGPTQESLLAQSLFHPELLRQALAVPTARSGGADPLLQGKERLEYLGDAVIAFVVSDYLYRSLPAAPEGVLSAIRAAAVSAPSLAELAEQLGVPEALRLAARPGRGYTRLLAATLEALVGALYCDGGLDAAEGWIGGPLTAKITALQTAGYLPPKTRLQEHTQHGGRGTPQYRVVAARGAEHARTFAVEVHIGDHILGAGEGPSRRAAEQAAAATALMNLGLD